MACAVLSIFLVLFPAIIFCRSLHTQDQIQPILINLVARPDTTQDRNQTLAYPQIALALSLNISGLTSGGGQVRPTPYQKRYTAIHEESNWYRAEQFCVQHRMRLVTVDSHEDNVNVANLLRRNNMDKAWVGLNDLAEPGRRTWSGTGFPANYTNWDAGQPNANEHCVAMHRDGGRWHDYPCEQRLKFVCE